MSSGVGDFGRTKIKIDDQAIGGEIPSENTVADTDFGDGPKWK